MYDKRMRWQLQNKSGMSEAYDCKYMRGMAQGALGVLVFVAGTRYSVLITFLTDKKRRAGCALLASFEWHRL